MPANNVTAYRQSAPGSGPIDVVSYGDLLPTENEFRLLGDVKGKRVLELGCRDARNSIAFAKQGATALAVDQSADQLDAARRLAEQEEVRVELRQSDMAELALMPADNVDLVFSAFAFQYADDLGR